MEISQQIKDHVHQSFHQQAFLTLIDAKLEHVEKGAVRVSCCYRDDLTQQNGYFHGGVITTLATVVHDSRHLLRQTPSNSVHSKYNPSRQSR